MTIITPCTRPQNLYLMSLYIPSDVRWIVVFDSDVMPIKPPSNCEAHCYQWERSVRGNAQRNYGLCLVESGYVYFLDDDTLPHPKMWRAVAGCEFDIVSFAIADKNGNVMSGIRTGSYVVKAHIATQFKFRDDLDVAGLRYAEECYKKADTRYEIGEVLGIHNALA